MIFQPVFASQQRPLLIAGPCSAESETQVLEVAKALKAIGIHLFRAGIWKPRTRPDSFEGVGYEGLKWLKQVREELQLPVTTEVAKGKHVDAVLEYGIDVLWLGARTTVNPFSVQEIAEALQGVDVPVLVKNPLNADIQLWIGAIERIYKAGIRRIAAVHRGFYKYGEKRYRNIPYWQIPIELKRQFPDLQLICDHSHICGNPALLQQTAQRALDLNYDCLMTEVHPDPLSALSDSRQQIKPSEYEEMIRSLIVRVSGTEDSLFWRELDHIRRQIDEIDDEVFQLFSERMQLAEQIGLHKRNRNISIYQPERWNKIRERILGKGVSLKLAKEFLSAVIDAVHQESIQHQGEIMNSPLGCKDDQKNMKSENSLK